MIGVLPVDKPEGPTSHDIVAIARRGLGIRRIGHTGTLDPFATGLLLLCVGQATRLAEYLTGLDKTYEATARLGIRTDTQDRTGTTLGTSEAWRDLSEARIYEAFVEQVGHRVQTPPAYSAKKVGGRRAYDRARAGETVDLKPIDVEIQDLHVLAVDGPDVRFRVRCSSGTYVRTLAADAGDTLGVGAHLIELRRTAVGRFTVEAALTVELLADGVTAAAALIPPLAALDHMPAVMLTEEEATHVRHGRSIPADGRVVGPGPVALALAGQLMAVAESDGNVLRPRKVLG
jgi:tRNA pseudouridine55 synthase